MFETVIAVPEENRKTLVDFLNTQLANAITAQLVIKNAHWNVKGEDFYPTHKLFDKIFKFVVDATDDIAERITTLGGVAQGLPVSVRGACTLSSYRATDTDNTTTHIAAMANFIGQLSNEMRPGIKLCAEQDDLVTQDLLLKIIGELEHHLYFLEAGLRA